MSAILPTAARPATPLLSREHYAEQRRLRCQRHAALPVPPHLLTMAGELGFRCAGIAPHGVPLLVGQQVGQAVRDTEHCLAHLLTHRGTGAFNAEQTAVMRELALRLQAAADCLLDQVGALNEDRADIADSTEGAQP